MRSNPQRVSEGKKKNVYCEGIKRGVIQMKTREFLVEAAHNVSAKNGTATRAND
ncbi:hypothetical protein VQL36_01170 [Chengkuizengella sp. SCS-71B]|uniref:hypothetical protein n=1 Tax=Chengkuizengella sp. SCS-71B TaxID=3115290 RepID=UPI0032C24936